jgi:acetyl/propionyl-CoA carboxylase alpha subunit/acetyl-CoA carboxylase carboxyltransferase component
MTHSRFARVAIVNRGEAAMRAIHAVRELNWEQDTPTVAVALFTEPDRHSMYVRHADDAVSLGAPTFLDVDGNIKSTYLDYERLGRAIGEAAADAAWVGWGFVAEDPAFAEMCEQLGVVFVGPEAAAMRRLGNRINAKRLADEAGLPVAPWSDDPVESLRSARLASVRTGYPLLIKAAAGGGRGIRRVEVPDDLAPALGFARADAYESSGDASVLMERFLPTARHVEVQVIADHHGSVWSVGVRDGTIQRRNQKRMVESGSTALSRTEQAEVCEAAARLFRLAGYTSCGTVNFFYEPGTHAFSFIDVNASLEADHGVTEETTGLDLVKLQLRVARGGRLEGGPPRSVGHAIGVRISAEDLEARAPAPRTVDLLRLPGGPGVRVDTGVSVGDSIPEDIDSAIAKLIVWGRDRREALARLTNALSETEVIVGGGSTNRAFLLGLVSRPEVVSGEIDVSWLDRLDASGGQTRRRHLGMALLVAAIEAYDEEFAAELARFFSLAVRGRAETSPSLGQAVHLRAGGHDYRFHVYRLGPSLYRVVGAGREIDLTSEKTGRFDRRVSLGGRTYRVLSVAQGARHLIDVDGVTHWVVRDSGGVVRSPLHAMVIDVLVKEGDEVAAGDRLLVLEAMKTEMSVAAPTAGRVTEVLVAPNVHVAAAAPLLELRLLAREAGPDRTKPSASRSLAAGEDGADRISDLDLVPDIDGASDAEPEARCRDALDALRRQMLGFDVDPRHSRQLVASYATASRQLAPDDEGLLRSEDRALSAFADVCSLARTRPDPHDLTGEESHSAHEDLLAYLRSIERRGAGLAGVFLENLRRCLGQYGIQDLEPTPKLRESLFWMAKAQQRIGEHLPVVQSILDRRLEQVESITSQPESGFRSILDRLISASPYRFPDLARQATEVRYQYFERLEFDVREATVYAEAAAHLDALERSGKPERDQHMAALVECPRPLKNFLTQRFEAASATGRRVMLEAITRRYYRMRRLEALHFVTSEGTEFALAQYNDEGAHVHLLTAFARYDGLGQAMKAAAPLLGEVPGAHDAIIDFYLWRPERPLPDDTTAQELQALLGGVALPHRVRRLVAAISAPGSGLGMAGTQHFTFCQAPDGSYQEDPLYRGFHPMMGDRLLLQRMCNFRLARLPSVEDVYLFFGVAHANPRDERLFALAEVRDTAPLLDEAGFAAQLPGVERKLLQALAGIRAHHLARPPEQRLHMNRVVLYVWPVLELSAIELQRILHQLAPNIEGLGIDEVVLRVLLRQAAGEDAHETMVQLSNPTGAGFVVRFLPLAEEPLPPLTDYEQRVDALRRRGLVYPYELVSMLTASGDEPGEFPPGQFVEYDFDDEGKLVPVLREPGCNSASIVVGILSTVMPAHPEGMARVALLGDPSKGLGSLAEPECRRIMAAIDLAAALHVPVEWFALSAGAKIAMDSGTENMDWIARVLRRIVHYTQAGGEINVVVAGINVGAQPYWNAEATMLMHTRGILVMTPDSAMVLTGKQALEYSGGVSAEDNQGIGGYERVMGPNGQAQFWAPDISAACHILLRHYEHTYVALGERFPRRAASTDPVDRDVRSYAHEGSGFSVVGELFADETNAVRKHPFDIRSVMRSAIDQDYPPLERWAGFRDAESAVVWDAHLGGWPVCLIGLESRPLPRWGFVPADGPDRWTSGTLFPLSAKKVARAVNAASNNRPLVVLANLSGFDASPESMRKLQLEYGAEIGRAVVNFRGPLVFCVVSRYHGGAFVVFSAALNDELEVAALEGSFASVIGGGPAAAVVFAREVDARTAADQRVQDARARVTDAEGADKTRLRAEEASVYQAVRFEKLGELAREFDHVHSVERARAVGSIHRIIPPAQLRPYLVEAVTRGIDRALVASMT